MPSSKPSSDAGFSLVETLAALGILALAALPLMQTATSAANATRHLENRMLARIVAENVLSFEMVRADQPDAGIRTGVEAQMGRTLSWTVTAGPAQQGEVQSLQVAVRLDGQQQILAELSGLRAVPGAFLAVETDTDEEGGN
ncbi:MAG: type II secretion system minor pseudopilin GspI [Pseudomonadota bacterium]